MVRVTKWTRERSVLANLSTRLTVVAVANFIVL